MARAADASLDFRIVNFTTPDTSKGRPIADTRTLKPSWPSGRKQACVSCRQRKKKCDVSSPQNPKALPTVALYFFLSLSIDEVEAQLDVVGQPWAMYKTVPSVDDRGTLNTCTDYGQGQSPTCGLCARAGTPCSYPGSGRMNGIHKRTLSKQRPSKSRTQNDTHAGSTSDTTSYEPSPSNSANQVSSGTTNSPSDWALNTPQSRSQPLLQTSDDGQRVGTGSQPFLESADNMLWSFSGPFEPFGDLLHHDLDFSLPSPGQLHQQQTPSLSATYDVQPLTLSRFEELYPIFLKYRHSVLPCLNADDLREAVAADSGAFQTSPLCWTIAGSAAWHQKDEGSNARSKAWINRACEIVDENIRTVDHPLPTLQALIYLVYHAYVSATLADMWMQLGKACRLTSLLGWDRLDSKVRVSIYAPHPVSEREQEERRRAVWMLFLLDRAASCITGWPFGLRERQFLVKYPLPEPDSSSSSVHRPAEYFSVDIAKLLSPEAFRAGLESDRRGFILRGYFLLGRIIEYHNDLHAECDPGSAAFSQLQDALTRFDLMLTWAAKGDTAKKKPEERFQDIWLRILIETCVIIHYHPTVDIQPFKNTYDNREPTPGHSKCIASARKIVKILQDASFESMQGMVNPMLLPSCFLACRFLKIASHETPDGQDKSSIGTILMVVEAIAERFEPLAHKYRKSILHDVNLSSSEVQNLRKGTGCYLNETCKG